MEATLNNLQRINVLRVVSRTSAEKYRNTAKTIPELADELKVHYVVDGSGQNVGNRILLNIQLLDARRDSHLRSEEHTSALCHLLRIPYAVYCLKKTVTPRTAFTTIDS